MTHETAPHGPMLLAEDLLLLLTDDATGSTSAATHLPLLLGGAHLCELALDGTVALEPKSGGGIFATDKIVAVTPPANSHLDASPEAAGEADPLLAHAWSTVAEKPRSPADVVGKLGKGAREQVADRLGQRGILERVDSKVLGLFPRTRWPAADMAHERAVLERLHACLVIGLTPDPRTASLIGLLDAADLLHKVVPSDLPRKEMKRRAKAIAQDSWATDAARQAVEAINAAVVTGIMATTVAASS